MSLVAKQAQFTREFAAFLVYADVWATNNEYTMVLEECYRHPTATHGHANSLHRIKLAAHILLFYFTDGALVTNSDEYTPLGEAWEALSDDNCWGGRFTSPDGVHFSKAHGGMK